MGLPAAQSTAQAGAHLFPHCRADEGKGLTMSPRKSVYRVSVVEDNREDGRFFDFAQNDMSLQSASARPIRQIIPAPNLSCCGRKV